MIVQMYHTDSPNNKLIKDLSLYKTYDATPYGPVDVDKPQMIFSSDISDYNYAYIPEYNKYYFVNAPVLSSDGMAVYELECDALMTNYEDILNLDVTIKRSETIFNEYIDDGTFVPDTREFVQCVTFEDGFNETGELILITAGGIATI